MRLRAMLTRTGLVAALTVTLAAGAGAQQMQPTTRRAAGEGEGPFPRLILRGATLIDGTGAPPRGPVDIVVEGDRIAEVVSVGYPGVAIDPARRPGNATREIDAAGMYVLPGFIDTHVHTGGVPKAPQAEYVYKLWLAHGVTTVRGVPFGEFDWSLQEKALSARNQIVAPHLVSYHRPGTGKGWKGGAIRTPDQARAWVRWAAGQGIDGLKLGAFDPEIMAALIDEARKRRLGTVAHLDQIGVGRMTALDAARLGLGSTTHFYGLFESLLRDRSIQSYPADQNYNDEQHRFGQVARLAEQSVGRGDPKWNAVRDELLRLDLTLNPTLVIYSAGRDVMAARRAEWHDLYTLPTQWDFYQPSREAHGSYWFDWTTHDEVAWRGFYHKWMQFLNDYKNQGGRVTVGTDCGFIYQLYGFCYVTELEMLQEAGFHPLEVVRAATMHAAEELHAPSGGPLQYGIVRPGLRADLVVVPENPLHNFKTLYGTGAVRISDETGRVERVGGVRYTIKDGIVYDAPRLLADVRRMVAEAKRAQPFTTQLQPRP